MSDNRNWLIFIALILLQSNFIYSQGTDYILAKGDSLFDIGEYDNALLEYERAIFFSGIRAPSNYHLAAGKCYYALHDNPKAKNHFIMASEECGDDSLKVEMILKSAICDLESNNYYGALKSINSINFKTGKYQQDKIDLYIGIAYWGLNDYESAFKSFIHIVSDDESQRVNELVGLKSENRRTLQKDPKIFPLLSGIIPGSGQFILGSYKEALTSTFLCGGLAFIGIESIVVLGNNVVFLNLWPWFFRYYAGGIQRTIELAEQKRLFKKNEVYHKALDIISDTLFMGLFDLNEARGEDYLLTDNANSGFKLIDRAYLFYKKVISPQDLMDCIYYPSCSTYALETIKVNGFLGFLDAIDRLTRCHLMGHDTYPIHDGNHLFLDPVTKIRQAVE